MYSISDSPIPILRSFVLDFKVVLRLVIILQPRKPNLGSEIGFKFVSESSNLYGHSAANGDNESIADGVGVVPVQTSERIASLSLS